MARMELVMECESAMESEEQLVDRRLSALELAETLGNVAEACRRANITRTQYYIYKARYEAQGREGLRNRPPIAKSHPQTTPVASIRQIEHLAIAHPGAGCNRLQVLLRNEGGRLSGVTIQKHLTRLGLANRHARWLALERLVRDGVPLSEEQNAFIEQHNPCFRERHTASSRPGTRFSQDTLPVVQPGGAGRLWLHSVVDTFSGYAFAALQGSKRPEAAVALLFSDVLPFCEAHGWTPAAIVTDNGREFCGSFAHPYELYLQLNGIVHLRSPAGTAEPNGFSTRFHADLRNGGFHAALQRGASMADLQAGLAAWLARYNRELPFEGYPNFGRRPWDVARAGSDATVTEGG